MTVLAIAIGGALGAVSRFFLSNTVTNHYQFTLPVGTLGVNILGSFALGVFYALFSVIDVPAPLRLFLTAGFLGALTTFSTYSIEAMSLFQSGQYHSALLFIFLHNGLGILMAVLGFGLVRLWV